ncbi:MAG TPA: cyclic 2,3-diphosphoglycerate synthase [bacterium]|nr:MAG: Cyclic 2,3-diphosphoglycerate synthetase [bacterium ADurb.Bin270]HPW44805.1 cyclic 2,3-diphosphoglycerate synthase [bacterium]HQC50247.1 cyclic 2,3-diphosphoglycerate synthase [bacterium]
MTAKRVLIMGAAGRDFHNFNTFFKDNPEYEVVAFTATQIPNIHGRIYPSVLAGKMYPDGIEILPEEDLSKIIKEKDVDLVVFSYSDVEHKYVMEKGSQVLAAGANYMLLSPTKTQIKAKVPVISVCAVRTGCGKSQTSRKIVSLLIESGKKVVAIRHPMPYGDLAKQAVQRFASYQDLDDHNCTIEEREEYEPYIDKGLVVYAGVDYEAITRQAEKEADIIIWDGGNNDMPFLKSDLEITVLDPLRAGHERSYFPGETNFLTADVLVINKYQQASAEQLNTLLDNIKKFNPDAKVIKGDSKILVDDPKKVKGKKVLVVEDGPTLTHGGMSFGAGMVAADEFDAQEIVDPRPYAVGSIKDAYTKYPNLGKLIPALGYYDDQLVDLEKSIAATPCDLVLIGSPIDIRRVINLDKPAMRVYYELEEMGEPTLKSVLKDFVK